MERFFYIFSVFVVSGSVFGAFRVRFFSGSFIFLGFEFCKVIERVCRFREGFSLRVICLEEERR